MKTCICESCQNLKDIIDDKSGEIVSQCEFDLPTDECENCTLDGCDAVCEHYMEISPTPLKTAKCAGCGKEITVSDSEETIGELYCLDCYLKR